MCETRRGSVCVVFISAWFLVSSLSFFYFQLSLKLNQIISPRFSSVALSLPASSTPPPLSHSASPTSRPLSKLNTPGDAALLRLRTPLPAPLYLSRQILPPPPPQLQPFIYHAKKTERWRHRQLPPESPHAQQKPTRWQFVERKCNLSPSTALWGRRQTMRGSD